MQTATGQCELSNKTNPEKPSSEQLLDSDSDPTKRLVDPNDKRVDWDIISSLQKKSENEKDS